MSADLNPPERPRYLVAGQRLSAGDPALQAFLEAAYRERSLGERPRCLCTASGAEMYVTRIGGAFHLKRMPGHGVDHAWSCASYEPPVDLSGLGQVLGAAIQEDPLDGTTSLKLGFSLAKVGRRTPALSETSEAETATSSGARLSLRGLLHYIWEEAGFNSWSPAMNGKRSWPVVHKYLLAGVERKRCRGAPLSESLFIPEPWEEARKDEIAARRRALFLRIASVRKTPRKLMLLLGEVRLIEPARYGHRLVVKHAPDVEFGLDDGLVAAMKRRFETELATWEAQARGREGAGHMVVFGTFSVGLSGRPAMEELVLMSTSGQWIPVEDAFDGEVVERLTSAGYRFTRCLRYNLPSTKPLACAIVPQSTPGPTALYVIRPGVAESYEQLLDRIAQTSGMQSWIWRPGEGAMPDLPARGPARSQGSQPQTLGQIGDAFDPFGQPGDA
jgi:hypothetical protein